MPNSSEGSTENISVAEDSWNHTETGKVYWGDCFDGLQDLEKDSITLGFTSPPYFDAVNYEEHVEKKLNSDEKGYWERDEDVEYESYRHFLMERFKELYRVTKPGGHTIVNLSPVHSDGERVPLPYHFVTWMENQGWTFKEDIIWEKPVAKDRRSGVLLQHPYPGYYYPSVVAEYVLVFQKEAETKGKNNIYWNRTDEEKAASQIDTEISYQGEKSKNVWKIRPVAPSEIDHPAPFPQKLAERVIELYSYKGDTVIDIFGGSGQTYLAAKELGREFIGFDVQKEYVKMSLERVREYTPKNPTKIERINSEIGKIERKIETLKEKKKKLQKTKQDVVNRKETNTEANNKQKGLQEFNTNRR